MTTLNKKLKMFNNSKNKNLKKLRQVEEKNKTAQDVQDENFKKMPVSRKIELASDLTAFCLFLNKLK